MTTISERKLGNGEMLLSPDLEELKSAGLVSNRLVEIGPINIGDDTE
jgi:hypothetical protein